MQQQSRSTRSLHLSLVLRTGTDLFGKNFDVNHLLEFLLALGEAASRAVVCYAAACGRSAKLCRRRDGTVRFHSDGVAARGKWGEITPISLQSLNIAFASCNTL